MSTTAVAPIVHTPAIHPVTIAIDTEFHGTHTLSVQAAARIDPDTIAVHVYHGVGVPTIPWTFNQNLYLPVTPAHYGRFCKRIVVRADQGLPAFLSPAHMVQDLFDRPDLDVLSRRWGQEQLNQFDNERNPFTIHPVPENIHRHPRTRRLQPPVIDLTLVTHFQRADFLRCLGRDFLEVLQSLNAFDRAKLVLRSRKLIEFVEQHGSYHRTDPLLQYLWDDPFFYALRVRMRDTMLPFGPASLDSLSRTFLDLPKSQALSPADKEDMLRTYRDRPEDAYGYAMVDAVNTLLIYEQMQKRDAEIYTAFGFATPNIPPLRATLGGRVSTFLTLTTRTAVEGSQTLKTGSSLQKLMRKGGVDLFAERPDASKYGSQTGRVHGGLLFSRSPTQFWHEAPGMLRDVDMAGCYNAIAACTDVYWGRPVILETGGDPLPLAQAVELVQKHAAPDAWMIRVTGDIGAGCNVLIPSTEDAITSANYRGATGAGKRRQGTQQVFHLEAARDPASVQGTGGAKLYTHRIDSGVVTWATWRMIQALPAALRKEYEQLTADSVIFYPRELAADDGIQFDALVEKHGTAELPWTASLDLARLELVRREKIDADYVTMKFPLGMYASQIGRFRKDAQKTQGKGSGADLAWKQHGNTMYGVLASPYLPTNNFVAANHITAHARAEAFALSQALNAIQTITDGSTYRLDQIPACTYAECLKIKPDYPLRRAEAGDGVPFLDPATIPQDDVGFTKWYRAHVGRFFEVSGQEHAELFAVHNLEHKKTGATQSVSFDALACDGSGNYAKLTRDGADWRVEDFAARSYSKKAKKELQAWLVSVYSTDQLAALSPIVEDMELLSFKQAAQRARAALDRGVPAVYFPLGLAKQKVLNYKAIKASAFLFQTPEQRAKVVKQLQKFEERTGSGLELLALRRGYGGRREGSIADVAEEVYRLIRSGRDNLTTTLNLNKLSGPMILEAQTRVVDLRHRKSQADQDLDDRIDVCNIPPQMLRTGYVVTADDVDRIREGAQEIIVLNPARRPQGVNG